LQSSNQNHVGHTHNNPKIRAVTNELMHPSVDVGYYKVVIGGIDSPLSAIKGKFLESRLVQANHPPYIYFQML
jgi:hypothetical protein